MQRVTREIAPTGGRVSDQGPGHGAREERFHGSHAAHQPEMVTKVPLAGLSFAGHPADRRRGPLASGYCGRQGSWQRRKISGTAHGNGRDGGDGGLRWQRTHERGDNL